MINCEGVGEGITVGSEWGVTSVLDMGVAEWEQAVSKAASR